jgi:hypothetical protein
MMWFTCIHQLFGQRVQFSKPPERQKLQVVIHFVSCMTSSGFNFFFKVDCLAYVRWYHWVCFHTCVFTLEHMAYDWNFYPASIRNSLNTVFNANSTLTEVNTALRSICENEQKIVRSVGYLGIMIIKDLDRRLMIWHSELSVLGNADLLKKLTLLHSEFVQIEKNLHYVFVIIALAVPPSPQVVGGMYQNPYWRQFAHYLLQDRIIEIKKLLCELTGLRTADEQQLMNNVFLMFEDPKSLKELSTNIILDSTIGSLSELPLPTHVKADLQSIRLSRLQCQPNWVNVD